MIILIKFIITILLVFMNGFFVATEFAMVKVRKSRIDTLILDGNKNAKYTQKIINNLNFYLSACQLGITLASLGLGWLGEPVISEILLPIFKLFTLSENIIHSISFIIAFTIVTGLHIVLGELIPKSIAIISSEKIALYTAPLLIMFYKVTYPIIWVFNRSTNGILKLFNISSSNEEESAHTDEEIKLLVEDSYNHGLIDKTELTFVDNIFDFSEKTAEEIMVHRTDMVCFYKDQSIDEIMNIILEEQLTRYPICDGSKDNIIGFIHIKDLFKLQIEKNKDINSIIREIKFIPENLSISQLFKTLQKEREQIAIVIDEFGGTAGLVTIEDILEEIVGEIQDEFDNEQEEIKQTENGSFIIDGKTLLEDVNEKLDINIQDENLDTLGGWIYSQLSSYPQIRQKIKYDNFEFTILKCNRKRIYKILVKTI